MKSQLYQLLNTGLSEDPFDFRCGFRLY